jgi:two-component system LytT family response regulator
MNKIKTIIVDDESLARDIIRKFLSERNDIEIVAERSNAQECIKFLHQTSVDLMFLDIQMPKINGFELLEFLTDVPEVIFCTAFDDYAVQAFEVNAVDYLMKPFNKERLFSALDKALTRLKLGSASAGIEKLILSEKEKKETLDRLLIRKNSKIHNIRIEDIFYIEANDDYVNVYTKQEKFIHKETMAYLENHLNQEKFIRVHRKYIINIDFMLSIEAYSKDSYMAKMKNGESVNVSQAGYKKIKKF